MTDRDADAPASRLATWLFWTWVVFGITTALWIAGLSTHALANYRFLSLLDRAATTSKGNLSLVLPCLAVAATIVLLLVAAGYVRRGVWNGVLIDDRNRISLSRTQQTAWTVVLISGIATVAFHNASAGGSVVVPSLDFSLWAAMGLAMAASPIASLAIRQAKEANAPPASDAAAAAASDTPKPPVTLIQCAALQKNASVHDARWTDLFLGETENGAGAVDLNRVQHVIIGGMLLTSYGVSILGGLSEVSATSEILQHLPDPGGSFLTLMGLSHAGYLTGQAREV